MRSLPLPGSDRRRRTRQNALLTATAERIAVAEDQQNKNETTMDKIRSAWSDGFLTITRKGDNQ